MSKPAKIQAEKLIGTKIQDQVVELTDKDAIIYALGIGFSSDPLRQQDYPFTYELNDNFTAFPTLGTCITKFDFVSPLMQSPHMPQFSPFMMLHAQQRLQMVKPRLQPGLTYTSRQEIVDCVDKGKNALVLFRTNTFCTNTEGKQQLAYYNDYTILIKGQGGFGFKGKNLAKILPKIPQSKPDFVLKGSSYPGQAFLYRLSGDINPLHVDPNISAMQNYQKPILHGLCSYGIVARVIVQQLLKNNVQLLKSYHARFVGHVFPGQNYEILVWKNGNNLVFSVVVAERQKQALIGVCQLRQEAKL